MIAKLGVLKGKIKLIYAQFGSVSALESCLEWESQFAPWVAYDAAQKASDNLKKFGTGYVDGVIAPEVANKHTQPVVL